MNPAREKIESDPRGCLGCGNRHRRMLETAHVIDRSLYPGQAFEEEDVDGVVPLCGPFAADCHGRYDAHELDILPMLTQEEQLAAVRKVGIVGAYRRTTGDRVNREGGHELPVLPIGHLFPDLPF